MSSRLYPFEIYGRHVTLVSETPLYQDVTSVRKQEVERFTTPFTDDTILSHDASVGGDRDVCHKTSRH